MEFIKSNVEIDNNTGCWNWTKSVTSAGYGQFTRNGKYWTTHRYVYTVYNGEIPKGLVIRHLCHNTKCCNPDHLKIGSVKDNWLDSEVNHRKAQAKQAKGYFINGIFYRTHREAVKATKISSTTLIKFTDPITRIFDVDSYRQGCTIAGWKPKV